MSFLSTSDPLALLAIQAGQINAPVEAAAAKGTTELDSPQRFAQIGEPVPIVFARFRNSKGGILISPGATEARFENDASNNVTAYYMLVLSEGQLDSIPVKDVFQRACRVGAHTQTYNRRAGTWAPGNFLVQRAGKDLPEAPFFCGTVGSYPGISTLSFNVTIPDGFDQYNRQVHLFIRGGMAVARIYDSVTGPSDNFADLVKWLLVNTSRVPAAMIDDAALLAAATFLEVNGFTCNLEIRESTNYSDLAAKLAPYFLLAESNAGGKRGLRPLLPVTAGAAIKTTAITAEYTFTEDTVLPGTLEINYLSLADRQPFVAQMIWRQQLESDIGIIRTAEVRYSGTAETGPHESHDLSTFCTSEDHAVKVGAYILAKRLYTTHTIRFAARPQEHNTLISAGDIIRVRLERDNTTYANSVHDYLYQVERITKTLAGDVRYEATHFPIDDQGRSLIALDVAAAVGTGIILPSGRTGVSCDVNSSSDNTIPAETFTDADGADPLELSPSGGGLGFNDSAPTGDTGNADDGLDYETGIYFHNHNWVDNVLTVRMRLAPTGRAPLTDLGSLFASITSTSVVAVLPNGQLANPQPGSLPTLSFSGLIAEPWDPIAEGLPVPPLDRVFQGEFVITFYEGSFPPAAEDPAQQLTYRATVEFSAWEGGFTELSYLNTLVVDFVPTEAQAGPGQSIFYWSGTDLLSTGSETIFFAPDDDIETATLTGQPAVSSTGIIINVDEGLIGSSQFLDFTFEWYVSGVSSLEDDPEFTGVFLYVRNADNNQVTTLAVAGETVLAIKATPGSSDVMAETQLDLTGLVHLSIQRISGTYYLHVKGQKITSFANTVQDYFVQVFGTDLALGTTVLGQGRFTSGAALYGIGNFTPPSTAFYIATP
jgi:hypothetical protein